MTEMKMVISPHADEAKTILDKIRALRAEIPRLTTEGLDIGRKLSSRARVPDDFIEAVSVLIQDTADMEALMRTDSLRLRDSYGYSIAYEPVVQELLALAAIVANTIRVQRADAGSAALAAYAITRRLSREKGRSHLVPHVRDMRNKLHKKRARKASSDLAPAPVLVAPVAPVAPAAPVK